MTTQNMKNRILLLLTLLMMTLCASAQNMSDEQVLQYVMSETQKGTSQQEMAKELIKKGVNMQQLQRVKRKAESLQLEQGKKAVRAQKQRTRTAILGQAKEEGEETDNVMKTNDRGLYYTDPNDSLEYFMELDKQSKRQVFGRNIFNQENLSFQPAANMATPENYRLGSGDEVHIDIWGASQLTISETISPDGVVVIEGVGPINLGGKTVAQAKSALKTHLSQYYSDCQFNLSVGETRTIQVQVVGEVNTPGTYALNSLCSSFNALYAAGGISEVGTLRDIKVFRAGRQIATIDVYEYLVHGTTSGDVRLQDNDLIVVGPYDCLVQIDGKVKRPMWYEMKKTETVRHLLQYSGSFTGDAYTQKVRVIRKAGQEYSVHTVGEFDMPNFTLADEDVVQVDSVRARYSNMIEVRGAVVHAGKYQLGKEIQSVRELLQACDGLREDAYTERAIMHREKPDLTIEMVSVDVQGILDGKTADMPLQKNDVLFIPSKTEMLGDRTITISGEVFYPGRYPYADNTTLQDFIIQAGGLKDGASLAKVNVFRRVRDAQAFTDNGVIAEDYTFSLDENYDIISDKPFYLKPYDQVVVYKSPAYDLQKTVRVRGEANFVGEHAITKADYRLSDLIQACGGVTNFAYIQGASLIRTMTKEEIEKRDEANNRTQVALYESIIKDGKDINMALADSLLSMRKNTEYTYPVAIELDKAIQNPGSNYDLVLRENDIINIPEINNTVKVNGEVMSPVSMPYEQGKKLSYYIRHAGGYSHNASRSRVYGIRMNGSVVKLRSCTAAKEIQPGTEIYVPAKKATKGMSTPEIMAMTSAGASLASVIVALMNIIRK